MTASENYTYERIAKAIDFIQENRLRQPQLEEIAAHVNMSPTHFQRVFADWAGISPKRFLQYSTLQHAKSLLKTEHTLFDTTETVGLSTTSRLHDLFVSFEAMTPNEFKQQGKGIAIHYSFVSTLFGEALVASTTKGICYFHFITSEPEGLAHLNNEFPYAEFSEQHTDLHEQAKNLFDPETSVEHIKLHLKGTPFQLKVWSALLKIPFGELRSYGTIATEIGEENASRAVGTAIGKNPVAFLIPCHRVIQQSGNIGGYMWGETRKRALLAYEHCKSETV